VVALPDLDAKSMAEELSRAHVFVLPSFIENSPNSLAEAMLVGTPSVVSFVGGVPSMVTDEVEALTFPAGDEAVLAEQIRRVFPDEALADELSLRARATAHRRHLPAKIAREMLEIYRSVISQDTANHA
jgi:glycosyltransferase involved in cell wall biosynthesis